MVPGALRLTRIMLGAAKAGSVESCPAPLSSRSRLHQIRRPPASTIVRLMASSGINGHLRCLPAGWQAVAGCDWVRLTIRPRCSSTESSWVNTAVGTPPLRLSCETTCSQAQTKSVSGSKIRCPGPSRVASSQVRRAGPLTTTVSSASGRRSGSSRCPRCRSNQFVLASICRAARSPARLICRTRSRDSSGLNCDRMTRRLLRVFLKSLCVLKAAFRWALMHLCCGPRTSRIYMISDSRLSRCKVSKTL